jgi:hypothetical protein
MWCDLAWSDKRIETLGHKLRTAKANRGFSILDGYCQHGERRQDLVNHDERGENRAERKKFSKVNQRYEAFKSSTR